MAFHIHGGGSLTWTAMVLHDDSCMRYFLFAMTSVHGDCCPQWWFLSLDELDNGKCLAFWMNVFEVDDFGPSITMN